MGQQASAPQRSQEEQITHIDGGALKLEDGVYTGAHDWKRSVVRAQQLARRLAPYYKGLDDYEEDWTNEQLHAALKAQLPPNQYNVSLLSSIHDPAGMVGSSYNSSGGSSAMSTPSRPSSFVENGGQSSVSRSSAGAGVASSRPRAATVDSASNVNIQRVSRPRIPFGLMLYKDAVECPICFLYYPSNIATTRCCRQPICTECFVQIKRPNPHAPIVHADDPNPPREHPDTLVMEAPVCPYCNETDFGVVYGPPDFTRPRGFTPVPASERDVPAADPRVVLTDHIRPDWTAKLQRAKDRAARRAANAALITAHLQRQERRAQMADLAQRAGAAAAGSGTMSRRSQMEAFEEAQLAEAIRLSMLEDEDRRRRQAEEDARASAVSTASTTRPVAVSRKSSHSVHTRSNHDDLAPLAPAIDTRFSQRNGGQNSSTRHADLNDVGSHSGGSGMAGGLTPGAALDRSIGVGASSGASVGTARQFLGVSPESYNPHAPGPGSMPMPELIYAPPPDSFNPPIDDYLSRRPLSMPADDGGDDDDDDDDDEEVTHAGRAAEEDEIVDAFGELDAGDRSATTAAGRRRRQNESDVDNLSNVIARSLEKSAQPRMQAQRAQDTSSISLDSGASTAAGAGVGRS